MKRLAIFAVILALLGGFGTWWFSPLQVVKRRTAALLATLTLERGSGKVGRHAGTYSLDGLLAEHVELNSPTIQEANGNFERAELESAYSWLCDQAKETRFKLEKIHTITLDDTKATVKLTLNGLVELPVYRPADGRYDVTIEWLKGKDGWQLSRATWDQAR